VRKVAKSPHCISEDIILVQFRLQFPNRYARHQYDARLTETVPLQALSELTKSRPAIPQEIQEERVHLVTVTSIPSLICNLAYWYCRSGEPQCPGPLYCFVDIANLMLDTQCNSWFLPRHTVPHCQASS
jgi:hypothetical protein